MKFRMLLVMGCMLVAGCTTLDRGARGSAVMADAWVVLPFVNATETPYAAERAESIAEVLLYARGIQRILTLPTDAATYAEPLAERGLKRRQAALTWAKQQNARYALAGTVTEWRYKVGLDGEPVVGMTLQVIDLRDDSVLWSGSSAKSGWSREAVSAVAQQVLERLISTIGLH